MYSIAGTQNEETLDMGNWRRVAQVSSNNFMGEVNQMLNTAQRETSSCTGNFF